MAFPRPRTLRLDGWLRLEGEEQGKHYILEIFTWRDGSVPDNAPDEITEIWGEMSELVESRGGRPGVDFSHVRFLGTSPHTLRTGLSIRG